MRWRAFSCTRWPYASQRKSVTRLGSGRLRHVMKAARIGAQCNIGGGSFIESGAILGDRVTLKNQAMIWDGVQIGDDAFIGPGVIFTNDAYPRSPRMPIVQGRYADPRLAGRHRR